MNDYRISCRQQRNGRFRQHRRGAAVVEAALLTPLLVIVTLGAIDIGQLINISQTLSNASRIGTRLACRNDSNEASSVENAVRDYVSEAFPQYETNELLSAIQVSVHRTDGTQITKNLNDFASGEQLFVRVSMDFEAVRWMGAIDFWSLQLPTVECHGRRE